MIVKDKFELIKGQENITNISIPKLKQLNIKLGPRLMFVNLDQLKSRINHFTKDRVFNFISNIENRKQLLVINDPSYILKVTYNKTKHQLINLNPFNIDTILPDKPGTQNLYALLVYSITFSDLVSKKFKVPTSYLEPISNYIVSIFLRLFGKQYGLLGSYSAQIPKLKFLVNLYILTTFFGIRGIKAYTQATSTSGYNYQKDIDKLKRYKFDNINDLILALSDFDIMPNLNKHIFTSKLLRMFGIEFLPAMEDLSRFIAILTTSDIKGSNIVPTYLSKYNERDFNKVLEISKLIFKRK